MYIYIYVNTNDLDTLYNYGRFLWKVPKNFPLQKVYICMYVCMYWYMYIYIYVRMYVCIDICTYIYMYMQLISIPSIIMGVSSWKVKKTFQLQKVYILCMHIFLYVHICLCIITLVVRRLSRCRRYGSVWMCIFHMYVYMHVHIHVNIYIHTHIYFFFCSGKVFLKNPRKRPRKSFPVQKAYIWMYGYVYILGCMHTCIFRWMRINMHIYIQMTSKS